MSKWHGKSDGRKVLAVVVVKIQVSFNRSTTNVD